MFQGRIFTCTILVAACLCCADVQADMVDLTTAGASGTINGAWFYEVHAAATGSGLIKSFVRIDNDGISRRSSRATTPMDGRFSTMRCPHQRSPDRSR